VRVCLLPNFKPDHVGGVTSVVRGLRGALPKVGWEVTNNPDGADIVHGHALLSANDAWRVDVFTSHGVYPENEKVNDRIFNAMRAAQVVTSVAEWPTKSYWPGLGVEEPVIIRNGVDIEKLKKVKKGRFRKEHGIKGPLALWGKTSQMGVLREGLNRATLLPWACRDVMFAFTIWPNDMPKPSNVIVTGVMSQQDMLEALRDCDVYLSTTVENFPVMVLEAMGLEKPVLGVNLGGNLEVGYKGYTYEDGSLDDMVHGFRHCLEYRKEFGVDNRQIIEERYTWEQIASKYADVYERVLASKRRKMPLVSIVITCYNLKPYIRQTVLSALGQDFNDYEVIVVDDCSTDGSMEEIADLPVRVIRNKKNMGVVKSRNKGIRMARGRWCVSLDGDDQSHRCGLPYMGSRQGWRTRGRAFCPEGLREP